MLKIFVPGRLGWMDNETNKSLMGLTSSLGWSEGEKVYARSLAGGSEVNTPTARRMITPKMLSTATRRGNWVIGTGVHPSGFFNHLPKGAARAGWSMLLFNRPRMPAART